MSVRTFRKLLVVNNFNSILVLVLSFNVFIIYRQNKPLARLQCQGCEFEKFDRFAELEKIIFWNLNLNKAFEFIKKIFKI